MREPTLENQTHEPGTKASWLAKKPPLKPLDILGHSIPPPDRTQIRDLAMFNLAIDSKLRGRDLVSLRVRDVMHADQIPPPSHGRAAEDTGNRCSLS